MFLAVTIFTGSDELGLTIWGIILFISILFKISGMSKKSAKRQEAALFLKNKTEKAEKRHTQIVSNIKKNAQQDKKNYYKAFYDETDRLQGKYLTSRMCEELAVDMMENVCRNIGKIRSKNIMWESITGIQV